MRPQCIIIGRCCSLHAGSDRRDKRNIPKTGKNYENTGHVADHGPRRKEAVHQAIQAYNSSVAENEEVVVQLET